MFFYQKSYRACALRRFPRSIQRILGYVYRTDDAASSIAPSGPRPIQRTLKRISGAHTSELVFDPRSLFERTLAKFLLQHSMNVGRDRFRLINPGLRSNVDPSYVRRRDMVSLNQFVDRIGCKD